MRRPNRQLVIFTLSALDVLAMSTGVFVLLLVMLMPYYRMVHDATADMAAVRAAQSATVARVQAVERTAALHRAEASAAEAEAAELNAAAAALEAAAADARQRARVAQGGGIGTPLGDELDLIFVVDTTASMEPVLREISASLRGVARILDRLVPSVRIGFVSYKDRDTGLPPTAAMPLMPTDQDLTRIIAFIEALAASPIGSLTIEEDVHLGLAEAMAMALRPGAKQALVVVGDASVHQHLVHETLARVRGFVAADERRTVSALFTSTPSSRRAGDYARAFFVALAEAGRGEFNDHTGSMIEGVLLSVLVE